MLVTYFANDLSDPAVARRVRMLRIGGADVKLLQDFAGSAAPVHEVDGIAAVDLGQTVSGQLGARCFHVLRCSLEAQKRTGYGLRSGCLIGSEFRNGYYCK